MCISLSYKVLMNIKLKKKYQSIIQVQILKKIMLISVTWVKFEMLKIKIIKYLTCFLLVCGLFVEYIVKGLWDCPPRICVLYLF